MTLDMTNRGGATVAHIADLDAISAAAVVYLRMWCLGPDTRKSVWCDLSDTLGSKRGSKALKSFDQLCNLRSRHGRRPMMHHAVQCKCVGADEACFANLIAVAVDGDRDDAMLIATLMVRPDVAPIITALATEFGIALKQMNLAAPKDLAPTLPLQTTVH